MTREQPLVSVHVITYNQVAFIADTLRSALEQDYDRLEIVVADDGSSDGTREIVAEFAQRYPGRIVPILEGHAGITGNYNRALSRCTGKYVSILNGDDLYLPGKIRTQVEWMEESPSRALCGHEVEHFDSATNGTLKLHSELGPLRRGVGAEDFIVNGCPFASVSVMVRRATLPPAGLSSRLRIVLDWKFSIDALVAGGEFGFVEGVWARYRMHSGNVINTHQAEMWLDVMTSLALIEAEHPQLTRAVRRGRARSLYRRGVRQVQAGNMSEARKWLAAAAAEDLLGVPKLPAWFALSLLPAAVRQRASKLR